MHWIKEKVSQSLCLQFQVCWETCKFKCKYFKTILINRFRWEIILQGRLRQSLYFLSYVKENCLKAIFFENADKQLKLDLILAKGGDQTFEMGIAFIICPGLWTALWDGDGWGHGIQEHHQDSPKRG